MIVYKIWGNISSFWDGMTWSYYSSLYKSRRRAKKDIPALERRYSRANGYKSEFGVHSVEVIE